MFDLQFLRKVKYFLVFIVVYTIVFVLFFSTLSYTLPFVLALIVAIATRPVTRFFRRRLKLSRSISALTSTLIVYIIIFFLLTLAVLKVTSEARLLLSTTPDFESYRNFITVNLEKLKEYYDQVDPVLIQRIQEQLTSLVAKFYNLIVSVITKLLSLAIGLPGIILLIFITIIATFFTSRDILDISNNFLSAFSISGREKVKNIWHEVGLMLVGYVKSYSVLLTLTFTESFIVFSFIGVKYALLLSFVCAFVDILPIIGISAVFFPLAIYYMIIGKLATGIVLIVAFVLITVVRQIVEPKLISHNLNLHPLAVLAAIYIGIATYGFTGMIYLLTLMVFYNIFRKVGIL